MEDLIRRADAIDGLDGHRVERRNLNDWQEGWNNALDWVQECYLEDLPSAQPEQECEKCIFRPFKQFQPEIIRCKDCGCYESSEDDDEVGWCYTWDNKTDGNAFCSYAKRKGEQP